MVPGEVRHMRCCHGRYSANTANWQAQAEGLEETITHPLSLHLLAFMTVPLCTARHLLSTKAFCVPFLGSMSSGTDREVVLWLSGFKTPLAPLTQDETGSCRHHQPRSHSPIRISERLLEASSTFRGQKASRNTRAIFSWTQLLSYSTWQVSSACRSAGPHEAWPRITTSYLALRDCTTCHEPHGHRAVSASIRAEIRVVILGAGDMQVG